jgi:hypothetical protein
VRWSSRIWLFDSAGAQIGKVLALNVEVVFLLIAALGRGARRPASGAPSCLSWHAGRCFGWRVIRLAADFHEQDPGRHQPEGKTDQRSGREDVGPGWAAGQEQDGTGDRRDAAS